MISDAVGLILIFGISAGTIVWRWYFGRKNKISLRTDIFIGIFIILLTALLLLLMGRLPWCACNQIWIWSGDVFSEHNSQHITDPYSPTHFIHGILFYLLLWVFARRIPIGVRLLMAIALESAWEVIENTDAVIEYYRANTISLGYYGDSVINSISDIVVMAIGFVFSWKVPTWVSVLVLVVIEVFLAFWIKDNLTLNIIMFIHPFEAIKNWQLGM
ncbi:MAG: hypothetical protein COV29_02595 [Candidatus Yanofskybacteria bacterium CG10_big_fil_rev_8_21_14_0_10_36_16]|uniref:DUF2585 domain-containing protein n=1 Tax=Candidatus Yanofskybacteria bacterium CG10_big_fil_rev_8_21_14_0_10_36_16 TaxID=1975096 RepID=A0A2J0QAM3_9BACT|nr:MAG: hypothetical protein COV29_02595 [Candidatus Yanofskybacteria bacterium CG10_big_fil_rev_8_21_14_0_10_36_16]